MKLNNNQQAFLALVRAGLWEKDACFLPYGDVDYNEVYRLAKEQTVVGLIAAGLEHVLDTTVPKEVALEFAGEALQLEQRNIKMNSVIGTLIVKMRRAGIYTLLVKGQGIAQCYERPMWRACGDIDFFLTKTNYDKAKEFLQTLASETGPEYNDILHKAYVIESWEVEIHGTLHSKLSRRIDRTLDDIQNTVFYGGAVRSWMNGSVQVFQLGVDEDIVYIFTHILQHFFDSGIGLRQICDWCRLLWTYRDKINRELLEQRLRKMGICSEWKTFAYIAVTTMGIPTEAMPFYSASNKWRKKADKVLAFIMETGNMGHNRDYSYREQYSRPMRKLVTFYRVTRDSYRHFCIFPKDTIVAWSRIIRKGIIDTHNGK